MALAPGQTVPGRVAFVGLTCLDVLNYMETFPDEELDQTCLDQIWTVGGNAANSSKVLSQLGVACDLFSACGDDHNSRFVLRNLVKYGINVSKCPIRRKICMPTSCGIISKENGSRTTLHWASTLTEATFLEFRKAFRPEDLPKYSWIHFEGRNVNEVRKMVRYLVSKRNPIGQLGTGCPIISLEIENPITGLETLVKLVDYVFISKTYAMHNGLMDMRTAVEHMSRTYRSSCRFGGVICGWAELGAAAQGDNGRLVSASAYVPDPVVDTLGAGDTFIAAVISVLAAQGGNGLGKAVDFGCRVAGAKCGRKGFRVWEFWERFSRNTRPVIARRNSIP